MLRSLSRSKKASRKGKTAEAIRMAQRALRRHASKRGKRLQPRTLELAKYVILFTTFPAEAVLECTGHAGRSSWSSSASSRSRSSGPLPAHRRERQGSALRQTAGRAARREAARPRPLYFPPGLPRGSGGDRLASGANSTSCCIRSNTRCAPPHCCPRSSTSGLTSPKHSPTRCGNASRSWLHSSTKPAPGARIALAEAPYLPHF